MERNIIVVDDFYDDPDEVRNFGLTAEYPDPGENYTYPGKNSRLGFYNDDKALQALRILTKNQLDKITYLLRKGGKNGKRD